MEVALELRALSPSRMVAAMYGTCGLYKQDLIRASQQFQKVGIFISTLLMKPSETLRLSNSPKVTRLRNTQIRRAKPMPLLTGAFQQPSCRMRSCSSPHSVAEAGAQASLSPHSPSPGHQCLLCPPNSSMGPHTEAAPDKGRKVCI